MNAHKRICANLQRDFSSKTVNFFYAQHLLVKSLRFSPTTDGPKTDGPKYEFHGGTFVEHFWIPVTGAKGELDDVAPRLDVNELERELLSALRDLWSMLSCFIQMLFPLFRSFLNQSSGVNFLRYRIGEYSKVQEDPISM